MELHIFDTPAEVTRGFTIKFLELVNNKVSAGLIKPEINVAISGGNTPKDLFRLWAEEYKEIIPWGKINLFWVDERCVPPADPDSNFHMTSKYLLEHVDIPENNIYRIMGEKDPPAEAVRYAALLNKILPIRKEIPVFDIVLLGIGEDGHTASIFPGRPDLIESDKLCEVTEQPVSGQKRITLTGRIINNADYIAFIVTGENKAKVIADVYKHTPESKSYPASYINPSEYYLDKAAGRYL
jgi:6-phosphogluconolactonase